MITVLVALRVEAVKAVAARTLWAITAMTVIGVAGIAAGLVAAIRSGRADLTAKLGQLAAAPDWTALLVGAAQVTAAGGLLALGVGISWLFGREFAEGTIGGLFGIPTSRAQVALAKLAVFLGWAAALAVILPAALLAAGLMLGLGAPGAAVWLGLLRVGALVLLSAFLVLPCAWAATVGRNLLTGIATAVGLLMIAQVGALAAPVTSFPLTAPAVWALQPDQAPAIGLASVPLFAAIFAALTIATWNRLQLDR